MFLYLERPRTGHHPPPPLPKKTVPPFQEYRFGFEEEMPHDLIKEGVAEVKEGGEGVDGSQEGQKKKKNATRRMEQILKIHTEPERKQDLVGFFLFDKFSMKGTDITNKVFKETVSVKGPSMLRCQRPIYKMSD